MTNDKHTCAPENAEKMRDWITNRGGVAIWRSVNLSNPAASWSTPAHNTDGTPTTKPLWQAADQPERVITQASDIEVVPGREVKRFAVAINGRATVFKLTAASSRKVNTAVEKAGEDAWYAFDYETQEAVILLPDNPVPLSEWAPPVSA